MSEQAVGRPFRRTKIVAREGGSFHELERITRAYALVFDQLGPYTIANLRQGEQEQPTDKEVK